jgi:hypothetical protein
MEYVEKALQQLWFRLTGFNDSVSAQVRRSVESVLLGTFDFDPYDPDWSGVKGWHDIHPNWVSWTIPRAPTAPATAPVSRPVDTGDFILGSPW